MGMSPPQRRDLAHGFLMALPIAVIWIVLLLVGLTWVHAAWIFVLAAVFILLEIGVLGRAFIRAR
jgi:hypothetical protein